ncbi:MAG: bifunctional riboflavin kinase/FAD synthetase [Alphaproteobacteria bacterium]|nr:bifunctional riboflavin kinase/FAD synthetase [Alphaproteobacteria bacterium]
MQIFRDVLQVPDAFHGAVVALGNFDGVHLGHQEILRRCVQLAQAMGRPATCMTFSPHPREFFNPAAPPLRIIGTARKLSLLRRHGMQAVFLARFNAAFAGLSADRFVTDILHGALGAAHIVTGYNFGFGKGRGGTTDFLAQRAGELGMGFTPCPPVVAAGGMVISSSAIREQLARGHVREAAALLGHAYQIEGRVRHGDKRGRELGYPTANVPLAHLFAPRFGVYAGWLHTVGGTLPAAVNIGVRPQFPSATPLLEAHALEGAPQLYGQRVQVELTDYLREEARFDSVQALKDQMAADCRQARALLVRKEAV